MSQRKFKLLVICGIIVALVLIIGFSIPFIRFIEDPDKLRQLIESTGIFAPLMFCLLSMIQILIPFIPGEPFELLAGYMFGSFKGTILCLFAGSIASIIIILLVKKYGTKLVEIFFKKDEHHKLDFLKTKKAFYIYMLLFIVPGTPKDLLCYIGGLAHFDLLPLLLVTTLGRIPSIITSTIPADALGSKNYELAIIVYAITIMLSIVGILIYNHIQKKRGRNN